MSEKLEGIDLNAALKAYENGDDAAFDPIFNAMRAPLCFFINRYVNDPAAAEDIMMDTFAELLLNGKYTFTVNMDAEESDGTGFSSTKPLQTVNLVMQVSNIFTVKILKNMQNLYFL